MKKRKQDQEKPFNRNVKMLWNEKHTGACVPQYVLLAVMASLLSVPEAVLKAWKWTHFQLVQHVTLLLDIPASIGLPEECMLPSQVVSWLLTFKDKSRTLFKCAAVDGEDFVRWLYFFGHYLFQINSHQVITHVMPPGRK